MAKHRKKNEPPAKPKVGLAVWLAPVALALAVWVVYVWALDAPLIFDDLLSVDKWL